MTEPRNDSGAKLTEVTSPAPRQAWLAVYDSDPLAAPHHHPSLVDSMTGPLLRDSSRLYRFDDGQQIVLPMVQRLGGPIGVHSNLPSAWSVGGVLASAPLAERHVTAVLADLAQVPAATIKVRSDALRPEPWAAAQLPARVTRRPSRGHVLDLGGGYEVVSARYSKSTRRRIRKAAIAGVQVTECIDIERIDDVMTLLDQSIERWADTQNEPMWLARLRHRSTNSREVITRILEGTEGRTRLLLAHLDGAPVAAAIQYVDKHGHGIRLLSDNHHARGSHAVDAVVDHVIRSLCTDGAASLDLGETGASESLAIYKERFGAQPVDLYHFDVERLPVARIDRAVRSAVKRVIGFRDTKEMAAPASV